MLPQVADGVRGTGGGAGGGSRHSLRWATAAAAQGLLSSQSDGAKTKAAHACGRLGGRGGWRQTEGTLPGDCNLEAGPREDKLAAVTERKIKALGLDRGQGAGRQVSEELKEQSRLSVCPYWAGHYHFCRTNRQETVPQRHGA